MLTTHIAKLLLRVFRIAYIEHYGMLAPPLAHALIEFVEESDTPTGVVPVNRLRDCSTQLPQEGSECKVAWTDKKLCSW